MGYPLEAMSYIRQANLDNEDKKLSKRKEDALKLEKEAPDKSNLNESASNSDCEMDSEAAVENFFSNNFTTRRMDIAAESMNSE